MHSVYCITGVSGYLGKLLAKRLAGTAGCRVVGIDLRPPFGVDDITFYARDIRDPGIVEILSAERVDAFIHLAFYTHPEGSPSEAESVNLDGTRNVLRAIAAARVKHFVLASSAAAYGSHPDNPVPMKETQALEPNEDFYYSWHKAAQEKLVQAFRDDHPEHSVIILRPSVVIGPHIENPTGDALKQRVLIYMRGAKTPIQLIHEDDVVEAFYLAATNRVEGIFNVTAEGTVTFPEIAGMMHKPLVALPFWMLAPLASFGKRVGLSPVSAKTLRFIRNPIVIDGTKIREQLRFEPKYDTRQAFLAFVEAN